MGQNRNPHPGGLGLSSIFLMELDVTTGLSLNGTLTMNNVYKRSFDADTLHTMEPRFVFGFISIASTLNTAQKRVDSDE